MAFGGCLHFSCYLMTFTCAQHGKFYKIDFCPYCPAPTKSKTGRASVSATAAEWKELAEYLNGDADNMDAGNVMKPVLRKW